TGGGLRNAGDPCPPSEKLYGAGLKENFCVRGRLICGSAGAQNRRGASVRCGPKRRGRMSRYAESTLTFDGLKTVPIDARDGTVRVEDFGRPYQKGDGIAGWLESLPKILAGDTLRAVVNALRRAREEKRAILWGMGGHVIKCGLGDVLLDLMRQ